MSFEFGFQRAKRYKDTTYREINRIENYIAWKKWNSERYTLEEYLKEFSDGGPMPSEDKVKFYTDICEKNGEIAENLFYFCGWDNEFLCSDITNRISPPVTDGIYVLDKDDINEIDKLMKDYSEDNSLIPMRIVEGVTKDKDGKESIEKLSRLILETEDEDHVVMEVKDYTQIFVPSKDFDFGRYGVINCAVKNFEKVKATDLNEYIVWFYYG